MAVSSTEASVRPRWPTERFDPSRGYVNYSDHADELVVYFGERPAPSYVDFIDAPALPDAAVLVSVGASGDDAGQVVGVQVDLLRARAANRRPAWAVLAEPAPPPEAVAALVADIAGLFERYWTPAPPIEEWREQRTMGRGWSATGEG